MRQLNLTLISPGGMVFEGTVLPEDMKTEEIISELKEQLDLSDAAENGAPIRYFLVLPTRDTTMMPGQTLRDAGLENGDELRMMASESVTGEREPVKQAPAKSGAIKVFLSTNNPNKAKEVALPADLAVGKLINNLMAEEKPQYGQTGHFRMQSKALGDFLLPNQTLRSAGVPEGDCLSIQTDFTAGGVLC